MVTGAFGYTGRAVAELLLARGDRVRTLTNSPRRSHSFGNRVEVHPFHFDAPHALVESLRGADVLINTYWVRFNHRLFTFEQAVANTKTLFAAAARAGVRRIVHVSILHAEKADDLGYYRGKHELENALRGAPGSHAILRPGVLFGRGDILVNNIALVLRRLPVFGVFGRGDYRLRPLHVDDMAALAVTHADRDDSTQVDAVGPEAFTYRELVERVRATLKLRTPIIQAPPLVALAISKVVNPLVRDVIITREEIAGLMRGLLDSPAPAAGTVRLSEWMAENAATLGLRYASEVGRRVNRVSEYAAI